ncbi:MAG: enoyl-CoA hydratase [Alphaproteobacteria bacterium]|jgi:enoyl-CoA hydratase/carnithine racemase|nr:enoyl-CoA hydratase [Alphaproteobacteria bacterium]
MAENIIYKKDGHIVTVTLNRPEIRNAISDDDMIADLVTAIERINADNEVRCAILTGAGTAFSSGGNVKKMRDGGGMFAGSPYGIRNGYLQGIQRIPAAMYELDVPIIAAVNGPAIGAGCDLTCMCDIRIAGRSAKFAESFVKLGIIPGDGGAWFLPRAVGASKAREMAFTGDMVDADEALQCGLVSKVVEDDKLQDAAMALAKRIAANPPHALRMAKRLLREGERTTLHTLLDMSASMQALAHKTEDHKEAVDAFLEKRAPVFKGK